MTSSTFCRGAWDVARVKAENRLTEQRSLRGVGRPLRTHGRSSLPRKSACGASGSRALTDSVADAFGISRASIQLRLKNIRAAARARTEIRKSDVMEEVGPWATRARAELPLRARKHHDVRDNARNGLANPASQVRKGPRSGCRPNVNGRTGWERRLDLFSAAKLSIFRLARRVNTSPAVG